MTKPRYVVVGSKLRGITRETARLAAKPLIYLLLLGLVACAPKVKLTRYVLSDCKSQSESSIDRGGAQGCEAVKPEPGAIDFFLRGSTIVIAKPGPDVGSFEQGDNGGPTFLAAVLNEKPVEELKELQDAKVTVVPLELNGQLYRAIPNDSFLYSPNISVSYSPSSLNLASLGTDSVEQGQKLLQVIGAVVTAVIAVKIKVPPKQEMLRLPILIDVRTLNFNEGWKQIPDGCARESSYATCQTWWYLIERAGPDIPSENVDAFLNRQGDWTREFPYAVCQDIRITISHSNPPTTTPDSPKFRVRIAHPSRVRSYLIPQKGQIKFHDICGADIAREGTDTNTVLNDLQALSDAVKQIKDARSAASSSAGN